jgi:predicted RNA-binding protein YlxR (DUF448 family)
MNDLLLLKLAVGMRKGLASCVEGTIAFLRAAKVDNCRAKVEVLVRTRQRQNGRMYYLTRDMLVREAKKQRQQGWGRDCIKKESLDQHRQMCGFSSLHNLLKGYLP